MDDLHLVLYECSPSNILQTLGPYLGNHIRRRSPDRLSLYANHNHAYLSIFAGDAREGDPAWEGWFVSVDMSMTMIGEKEVGKLCFDMIAHVPLEEVVHLKTALPILRSEEVCVRMRNLTHLHLERVDLAMWFVEPNTREPHVFESLLRECVPSRYPVTN